jgi:anti-sigma factor RsiW
MTDAAITCRELVELVTDYLEGALDPSTRGRVDEHLAACPGCRAYLDQMRTTISVTGRLHERDLEPAAREALLHAFRGWRRELT